MLGTLGALASAVGGAFLVFRGIDVFDCQSVSFSRKLTSCYPTTDFGSMTGEVAGVGLVVVGVALFMFALIRMATIR